MLSRLHTKTKEGIVLARGLTKDPAAFCKFIGVFFYVSLRKKFVRNTKGLSISFVFNTVAVKAKVYSATDFAVMREVFIEQEYRSLLGTEVPKTILDIGSNSGFSVIYWKCMFPDASIWGYEPDPEIFQRLAENVKNLSGIICVNKAVGSEEGVLPFYVCRESSIASSFLKRNSNFYAIDVPTITLDRAIKDAGQIDLIKFDIEGAEFGVFSASKQKNNVRTMIGEVHEDLTKRSVDEFISMFAGFKIRKERVARERYIVELHGDTDYSMPYC